MTDPDFLNQETQMTDPIAPVSNEPVAETPEPVLKAAALWGSLAAFLVTAVGVLVAVGVLSSEQAALLNTTVDYISSNLVPVGTVVVGLVGLISGLVSSHATALVARRQVTPVATAPRFRKQV